MKLAFMLCVLTLTLHGCSNVARKQMPVYDVRYGQYNEQMSELCAFSSMVQGLEEGLTNAAIDSLFNKCVFEQGLTI